MKLVQKPGERYPLTLSTVWNMSFETLNAEQQTFLNVIAILDPDRIQLQLLAGGAAISVERGNPSLDFMGSVKQLNKCKGPVVQSSLVTQNESLRELWVHRLVQQSCHLRMTPRARQESFDLAYSIVKLCGRCPHVTTDIEWISGLHNKPILHMFSLWPNSINHPKTRHLPSRQVEVLPNYLLMRHCKNIVSGVLESN